MKEEIVEYIQYVFKKTIENYQAVLNQYFPSFEKRFTERNLTFFFAHNYLMRNISSIVWQELPIQFEGKTGHIDTIIIDKKNRAVIFIEAKCLARKSRIIKRIKEIQQDLKRLDDFIVDGRGKCPQFSAEIEKYTKYILILADIWSAKEIEDWDKLFSDVTGDEILYSCQKIAMVRDGIEYKQQLTEIKWYYNLFYCLYKV